VSLGPADYRSAEGKTQFFERLMHGLESIPGVRSAGGITTLPMTAGGAVLAMHVDDVPLAEGAIAPAVQVRWVTPSYFRTMGIPILNGREPTFEDQRESLSSIVVSESIERQYWPDGSALGKRLETPAGLAGRIVGVVGDVRDGGLDKDAEPIVYRPMLDFTGPGFGSMAMVVRTEGRPDVLGAAVVAAVADVDPDLPVPELRPLADVLAESLSRTSFTMALLVLAAAISVFLAAVGIYATLSFLAVRQTPEIGVRIALGASPRGILTTFLGRGLCLALGGVVVGIAAALAFGGALASLLYEVRPFDPATLIGAAAAVLLTAAVASTVPAARAARSQPADALRAEA
jgi:predicted permease